MKRIIHVNQHIIKSNAKTAINKAVLTVKTYKINVYGHRVKINGPSEVVYRPNKPLSCGAKCWIETLCEVEVFDEENNLICRV